MSPKVYIAGPAVFLADAKAEGEVYREIAAEHGLDGRFPLDPAPDPAEWARPRFGTVAAAIVWGDGEAARIKRSCHAYMHLCDAVIADISPFRGPGADPGTAFEMGYMSALGKPVFAWSAAAHTSYAERVDMPRLIVGEAGDRHEVDEFDCNGMLIEDHGLTENLMLALDPADGRVHGSFDEACSAAARWFCRGGAEQPAEERDEDEDGTAAGAAE